MSAEAWVVFCTQDQTYHLGGGSWAPDPKPALAHGDRFKAQAEADWLDPEKILGLIVVNLAMAQAPVIAQRPATRGEVLSGLLSHLERQAAADPVAEQDLKDIEDSIADALDRRQRRKDAYKKSYLAFDSASAVAVGQIVIVQTQAQYPFKPIDLIVPDSIARCFKIHVIYVGVVSQGAGVGPVSCEIFASSARRPDLTWDTVQIGQLVSLHVENVYDFPMLFSATLTGRVPEDEPGLRAPGASGYYKLSPPMAPMSMYPAGEGHRYYENGLDRERLRRARELRDAGIIKIPPEAAVLAEDRIRELRMKHKNPHDPHEHTDPLPVSAFVPCDGPSGIEIVEPTPQEPPKIRCRCDKHDIDPGQDPYEAHRVWEETVSIEVIKPKTVIVPKEKPGDLVLPEIQHPDEVGKDVRAIDWLSQMSLRRESR